MIRRMLARHKSWLTFLGAGIVFITFLIKDYEREEMKDRVSALEADTAKSKRINDQNQIMAELRKWHVKEDYGGYEDSRKSVGFVSKEDEEDFLGSIATDRSEASLEAADVLAQEMPEDQTLQCLKQAAHSELLSLENSKTKTREALSGVYIPGKLTPATALQSQEVNDLGNQSRKEATARNAYSNFAYKSAEMEAVRRKKAFTNTTNWSYVLFGIGWLLGVLGNLADIVPHADAASGADL